MNKNVKMEVAETLATSLNKVLADAADNFAVPENQKHFLVDIAKHHLPSILSTLIVKGIQYNFSTTDEKPWSNILRISEIAGTTPQQTILVLMGKHWDVLSVWSQKASVADMGPLEISERIDDLVSYLLILLSINREMELKNG